jgi:hypothetical protein
MILLRDNRYVRLGTRDLEYSTGVRLIRKEEEENYRPRQFPFEASSFCMWGSRPDIPEFREKSAADAAEPHLRPRATIAGPY